MAQGPQSAGCGASRPPARCRREGVARAVGGEVALNQFPARSAQPHHAVPDDDPPPLYRPDETSDSDVLSLIKSVPGYVSLESVLTEIGKLRAP
jgi:hypothetical protein